MRVAARTQDRTGAELNAILAGTPEAFDHALEELGRRVGNLAPRLTLDPNPTHVAPATTR